MLWWQNLPFLSILLCLLASAACSLLPGRISRHLARSVLLLCILGAAALTAGLLRSGSGAFVFWMGHFPAPWGNEIRAGVLEGVCACLFPLIMLCALTAGRGALAEGTASRRENLYDAVCMLLMSALLAQVYSNDLFTCYVFLEIMTLSACALIAFRNSGPSLAAAIRYMVLNLVGSGLFLLSLVLLYDLTGHLLMENLHDSVRALAADGAHHRSLTIIIALMTVGLCVKSALFPFHSWVPDAYSAGVPSSNAILSSLVSKGYILLLLKVYVRVFGWDTVLASRVDLLLLGFSLAAVVYGSLAAMRAAHLSRMTAWSSVAQIGYIFLGLGLGTGGYAAAVFHLISHAFAKSLLFLSGDRLREAGGGSDRLADLTGAARRDPVSAVCWSAAALSMVGLPFTGGLVSKLLLGMEALHHSLPVRIAVLAVLALSTLLNVCYFLRTLLVLWSPGREASPLREGGRRLSPVHAACGVLALGVLGTFLGASPLLELLTRGLAQF